MYSGDDDGPEMMIIVIIILLYFIMCLVGTVDTVRSLLLLAPRFPVQSVALLRFEHLCSLLFCLS